MDLTDKITVIKGDITEIEVDAIVNAANTDLILGSGVAGAIRKKGGDLIQNECNEIGSIPLGEAAITGAGNLRARYVIHAAGMHLGGRVSEVSLKDTTNNSLLRASEKNLKKIAFPAIGTGAGGFPMKDCARVMVDTVSEFLEDKHTSIERVYFVLFDEDSFDVFDHYLKSELAN
ncbi:MAG TPA: macro domain-containing protein [Thermodesulfobacteriota bacterium]